MTKTRRNNPISLSQVQPAAGADEQPAEYLKPIKWTGRPDGQAESAYADWQRWTWRRFAWEYLRRSTRFQTAANGGADVLPTDPFEYVTEVVPFDPWQGTAQLVADRYGLVRFKHFSEDYTVGERPRFVSRALRVYSWLDANGDTAASDMRRSAMMNVGLGQVAIKFSLLPAITNPAAIETTMRLAERALQRQLEDARQKLYRLAESKKVSQFKPHKGGRRFDRRTLVDGIRLLDLLDARLEEAAVINAMPGLAPDTAKGQTYEERLKSRLRFPQEMANYRYLFLAAQ